MAAPGLVPTGAARIVWTFQVASCWRSCARRVSERDRHPVVEVGQRRPGQGGPALAGKAGRGLGDEEVAAGRLEAHVGRRLPQHRQRIVDRCIGVRVEQGDAVGDNHTDIRPR